MQENNLIIYKNSDGNIIVDSASTNSATKLPSIGSNGERL